MYHGRLLTTPPVPVSAVVLGGSDRCALAKQSVFRSITEGRRDKFPRHSRTRPPPPNLRLGAAAMRASVAQASDHDHGCRP
jgi:hypothetical protein